MIKYPSDDKNRGFGDMINSTYTLKDDAVTVALKNRIRYVASSSQLHINGALVDIEVYTEELYFQHSLLYSDEQLREIVIASILYANPIPECLRFTIYYEYVPMLAKLLRYKDNGII